MVALAKNLWPHQTRGISQTIDAIDSGENAVCLTSPTGTGKSRMMCELIKHYGKCALYTNRRMLLDQTKRVLEAEGIKVGVRAAGHVTDFTAPVQLCSIQTTDSRTLKKGKWPLADADLVLIDEAHVNREQTAVEIIRRHHDTGAAVVGVTATPLNIGHIYNHLVVAAKVSDGRQCGALVPAHTYAPDEPDCSKIKRTATGEYTIGDIRKLIMTHSIVGRVIDNWRTLNPGGWPTLLFAPGVKESLWFAEQLTNAGIPAAHLDGNTIWMGGNLYESDREARDELMRFLEGGEIQIVCNRFVLREGIDLPFIRHMIFATMFGALTAYIQSGGRGLRSHPGKDHCIIQDHGGNWHRHGSLNSDRQWTLDGSDYVVGETRIERMRKKKEPEPIVCPKCFAARASGPICPACKFSYNGRSRMVVQHDGTLREVKGDIYKPRRIDQRPESEKRWEKVYYRCKRKGMTFNQARGLYQYENNWLAPPESLPLMPMREADWFRQIDKVPVDRLHPKREAVQA